MKYLIQKLSSITNTANPQSGRNAPLEKLSIVMPNGKENYDD